jgi:hypothetical protein
MGRPTQRSRAARQDSAGSLGSEEDNSARGSGGAHDRSRSRSREGTPSGRAGSARVGGRKSLFRGVSWHKHRSLWQARAPACHAALRIRLFT